LDFIILKIKKKPNPPEEKTKEKRWRYTTAGGWLDQGWPWSALHRGSQLSFFFLLLLSLFFLAAA
jgi:hypothetical protein